MAWHGAVPPPSLVHGAEEGEGRHACHRAPPLGPLLTSLTPASFTNAASRSAKAAWVPGAAGARCCATATSPGCRWYSSKAVARPGAWE